MRRNGLALLLGLGLLPSCAYVTDRGIDFLDQYRAVAGVGTGGGIRASSVGLYHTGLAIGVKFQDASLGWKYGRPLIFTATGGGGRLEADQSWVVMTTTMENWDMGSGDYKLARRSAALLPAVLSWVDTTYRSEPRWYATEEGIPLEGDSYIWSAETWRHNRYAMIHAFDIEFEIGILAYLDFGYSPGETLDFLLGFLTIDLAKDDGRLWGHEE